MCIIVLFHHSILNILMLKSVECAFTRCGSLPQHGVIDIKHINQKL